MTTIHSNASLGTSDVAVSFGWSSSIAIAAVAVVNALAGLIPSFEEWTEATFSHPWLHLALLGAVIFLVLGLIGIGNGHELRRTGYWIIASTVVAGIVTVGAAVLAGSRGSM
jgi:hypothetical protein